VSAHDPTTDPRREAVALVGYRGTGKTTVGRLLAARLGWDFLDADEVLEAEAGASIPALFAAEGEPAFRDREADVLRRLTARDRLVLATGGGAVLRPENRDALRRFGTVVWLRSDPATLRRRLGANGAAATRPALTAAGTLGEVEAVLAAREPLYREVADLVLDTDGRRPGGLAAAIEDALRDPAAPPAGKDTTAP
jgi:shikimate kinase